METTEAYLRRKDEELRLIAACLAEPPAVPAPRSVDEAVEAKFRLAAALKGERARADWAMTETSWRGAGDWRVGQFDLSYEYQRADLIIRGPVLYEAFAADPRRIAATILTGSGMAAVAGLVMALGRLADGVDVLAPAGAYAETLELIEKYGRGWRLHRLGPRAPSAAPRRPRERLRVLLIDSAVPTGMFDAAAVARAGPFDLLAFDATCLSLGSGRVRRVLRWAERTEIPAVLLRSHAKLDSLGIEYGRLGSAVIVGPGCHDTPATASWLGRLGDEMRAAVRLLGGAPVPAHLPPFLGSAGHRSLSATRMAAIMRNGRRMLRVWRAAGVPILAFQHGLYAAVCPFEAWEIEAAKDNARAMATELAGAGLPVRHAGSFGFDFVAVDGFPQPGGGRGLVRIAFADLPPPLADEIAERIAAWWLTRVGANPDRRARAAA